MPLLSPSSNPNFTLFSTSQNPSNLSKFSFKIPILPLHSPPHSLSSPQRCSSRDSSTQVLDQTPLPTSDSLNVAVSDERSRSNDAVPETDSSERVLVVRRPAMEVPSDGESDDDAVSPIEVGLSDFAKKIAIFEPEEGVVSDSKEKPLKVNLDLALYRAKILTRNYRYAEAAELLEKCIYYWPEDGRAYVALGKALSKQSKTAEARAVYEKGCQATQGENPYIWQCWVVLEDKMGNTRRPRELFNAATVADFSRQVIISHAKRKAWGWMEWKEGNIATARKLYQKTLSINPTSETAARCLQAWGVLEERNGNLSAARRLFRSSLNINSQSYVTWMTWASLEENQGNSVRAEEIRDLYFQQRTEVVDDASWVMGLLDIIDPALDRIRSVLKLDPTSQQSRLDSLRTILEGENENNTDEDSVSNDIESESGFDVDAFCIERLFLDPSKLKVQMQASPPSSLKRSREKVL